MSDHVGDGTWIITCTYNIRTLQTESDLDRLIDKVEQIKWNVIGLCETSRKVEGLSEIRGGYWMYEMGKTEDNHDAKGLAFLIHPKSKLVLLILRHIQTE